MTFTLRLGFLALSDLKQTHVLCLPALPSSAACLGQGAPWRGQWDLWLSVFSSASNLLTGLILLHHHASGVVNDQLGQALTTSTVDTESPRL